MRGGSIWSADSSIERILGSLFSRLSYPVSIHCVPEKYQRDKRTYLSICSTLNVFMLLEKRQSNRPQIN